MNVTKCIEANNEMLTIEDLSNLVGDFDYEATTIFRNLKEKPSFQKINMKITFELRTE